MTIRSLLYLIALPFSIVGGFAGMVLGAFAVVLLSVVILGATPAEVSFSDALVRLGGAVGMIAGGVVGIWLAREEIDDP